METLTIAIPTYHRTQELLRLLAIIRDERMRLLQPDRLSVLVRDNSNDESTKQAIEQSEFSGCKWIDYKKNIQNVGFDNNILGLYAESTGDYVWFIGDDDIVFEGSVQKVLDLLKEGADVIHLPFRQPQTLEHPQYQRSPRVKYWMDVHGAVEQILKYIKITSFVLKRKSVVPDLEKLGADFGYSGWMHLILGFEVLLQSKSIKTITLSEFFAGSLDKEWKNITWTPAASLQTVKIPRHALFEKYNLQTEFRKFERGMYLGGIQMTLLVTSGKMSTNLEQEYIQFGAKYPFKSYLLIRPVWLIKYIIVRFKAGARIPRLIKLYEKVKKQN